MAKSIRVVVVDDSPVVCRIITNALQEAPDIEVVGTAHNGERAIELVSELQPDAVTLDLEMPKMNGLEALERIMAEAPTPVIMVSGASRKAADATEQALFLGAIDFVLKYTPGIDTDPDLLAKELVSKVRAASTIKVVRYLGADQDGLPHPVAPRRAVPKGKIAAADIHRVIVIGASTGGPLAIRELLIGLPDDLDAAIVIVQHMPPKFTEIFANQLDRLSTFRVKEAEAGDRLRHKWVHVAPGDYHLLIGSDAVVQLNQGPKIGGHRPCADVTMQSTAQVFGDRTIGVVLTGMGDDGTSGLLEIQSKGGKTFAQDAQSCVVNGMPQRAIERGVVDYVANPQRIAELLGKPSRL